MSRKINETLLELIIGILAAGAVIQAVAVAAAGFLPKFALGFWIGIAAAVGLSVHMYWSIDRALDMEPKSAEKYMRKAYMIRTVAILAVAGVVTYFELGYVMATFVGMLCLKFGAFLQPLTHRLLGRVEQGAPLEGTSEVGTESEGEVSEADAASVEKASEADAEPKGEGSEAAAETGRSVSEIDTESGEDAPDPEGNAPEKSHHS